MALHQQFFAAQMKKVVDDTMIDNTWFDDTMFDDTLFDDTMFDDTMFGDTMFDDTLFDDYVQLYHVRQRQSAPWFNATQRKAPQTILLNKQSCILADSHSQALY